MVTRMGRRDEVPATHFSLLAGSNATVRRRSQLLTQKVDVKCQHFSSETRGKCLFKNNLIVFPRILIFETAGSDVHWHHFSV